MKAAIYYNNGEPDVLTYKDVADPEVGPNTVLIRVAYAALQGGDLLDRRSKPASSESPNIVGYQAAGVVEALGAKVDNLRLGDRVAGFAFAGSHAELFAVEGEHAYPVPDGLDLSVAAALPIEFGTAHDALFEYGRLKAGETVLVRGAAGGVGIAAVQLAHQAGAKVIAIAATPERLNRIAAFGADYVIDYQTEDVVERVKALTNGRGVDLVLDMVGGDPLFDACAFKARYGLVGAASGMSTKFGFLELLHESLTVFSFMYGKEMGTPRVRACIADLMASASAGELTMPIERSFLLEDAGAAHAFAETARPLGRVLLKIEG
ncbi:zinc-binding dehydrogenase [Chryseobacterium sp. Ch-15]|uniref:Zinc-binding dehydrogenase n=1 Tax=Chryseobacterium muglaense TaxID=2893752 RepID=A0A9Q3V058_9FLAO|nr:zinc-binding dehydrogenase [Chryseobacterium muglaense]MBD3903280.1 zinc-binding dehydrogenase [Chryseobacterium muglaense]MCC9036110.1 zinc-binding dehydrogenase [Chryseobacterium muglaense]MCM2553314.1 zinc-binding dehydrogenase [Chryseobacterium muglaense]